MVSQGAAGKGDHVAHKGQVGNVGGNGFPLQDTPGVEATPPSPLAKVIETPRDVSCMYESHKELRKYGSDQYVISPNSLLFTAMILLYNRGK